MIRRLKEDVLSQLPDKRYEMTYVDLNGAIREVLAKEALVEFDPRVLFNPDFSLDGTPISTLRREMGEAMLPTMVDYLRFQLDIVGHPKLIAFAHHTSVIGGLMDDGLQSVCSDVVFCEPAWNPGRNEQCVDRVHRIGQHDNCVAHFLLVEGSFNEKVLGTVLEKAEDIHHTIDRRVIQ
jgi:SNF2 family DNA or RNA helicase